MLMPASSEFVTLCRSQVALAASFGASVSVVYLTAEMLEGGETKLIPIAAYPETSVAWEEHQELMLLPEEMEAATPIPRLLSAGRAALPAEVIPTVLREASTQSEAPDAETDAWEPQRQLVVPLIHEGAVLGVLVSGREDRAWNDLEAVQMEEIAHTLAIACILDQRSHWLQQQLSQQQYLQAQQHDALHNLLHQLKSPLTALRTFGKLLLKRLLPEDRNREVATSILRESDRLQELLQRFSETVDSNGVTRSLSPQIDDRNSRQDATMTPPIPVPASPALGLLPASNFLEVCSVREVLEPLVVSARAVAEEQQLELQAEVPNHLPPVKANAKALREVLSNLIDNALKYTPAGGKIYILVGNKGRDKRQKVKGRKRKKKEETETATQLTSQFPNTQSPVSKIAIAISDSGYGIPPQDLEHLFERHYRGEKAQTEIPGTGLGLAIARDLIHQMQGEIEVFSPLNLQWLPDNLPTHLAVAERGTTFVVWLEVAEQNSAIS